LPFISKSSAQELVPLLLTRFSTKQGYGLPNTSIKEFFAALRERHNPFKGSVLAHDLVELSRRLNKWENIVVGLITNSDDRVPSVLESFGLTVAPRRAGLSSSGLKDDAASADTDFQFAVMSYDVGYEKYNPSVLTHAKFNSYNAQTRSPHLQSS
jgi:hypothetical protein